MGNKRDNHNRAAKVTAPELNEWSFHAVKYVKPLEGYKLKVLFCNGTEKLYDMLPLIKSDRHFKALKDTELFNMAHLSCDIDYGITWNKDIDISSEEIWDNGETTATAFSDLISMREATDLFGLNPSTIRKAIQCGRFAIGQDVFKFGKQWVLVKAAVDREYLK